MKRTFPEIYDDLLRFQTHLSFDFEQVFFRNSAKWLDAKSVVDFGCGNAFYASQLAISNPQKKFYCVDKNGELLDRGRNYATANMTLQCGSLEIINSLDRIDYFYTRHVLSYLDSDSLNGMIERLSSKMRAGDQILIIDANDEEYFAYPEIPIITKGNERFKARIAESGGNRDIVLELKRMFSDRNFVQKWTRPLTIHSDARNNKYYTAMFIANVAELDNESPLSDEIKIEVFDWMSHPHAYLQIGLNASLYEKAA